METTNVQRDTVTPEPQAIANDSLSPTEKTLRNAHLPISQLPDEILAYVFSFNPPDDPFQWTRYPPSERTWITVTHVCRRWREVALGFPSLWSYIIFRWPKWTELMLQRAKMAQLDIDVELRKHHDDKNLFNRLIAALQRMPRVRRLKLLIPRLHQFDDAGLVSNLCQHPAPMLRNFQLHNYSSGGTTLLLPDRIFQGTVPRLKRLSLKYCTISWDSPLLCSQLTHLTLGPVNPNFRPTFHVLLQLLDNMPTLLELSLCGILPPSGLDLDSMSELTGPTAALPNLETLELTDTIVQDGLDFVRRLVFPNTAKAHVRLRHDPDALDCLPSIVLMIALTTSITTSLANEHPEAEHIRDPTPLRSLRITHLGGAGISMHLGTDFYSFQDWEGFMPGWQPKYSLSLSLPHHPSALCKVFVLAMCHSLPLEDLESLSIEGEFTFGRREWLYAFGHIEGLRDIRISGLPIFGFAEMFKKLEGPILDLRTLTDVEKLPTQAGIPIAPVMPALTHLAFEMADFVGSPELLHNVIDGLQLRKDAAMEGRAVDSVHIRDCDITEDQFHEFAPRLVGSCQWDMEKSGLRNVWVDEGRYNRRPWHLDDDIDGDEDDGDEADMTIVYG